ncbi:MAG: response regulator transcription factor [Herbaspirillum sp.]
MNVGSLSGTLPIQVGIADDYPVVLRGVESILEHCHDIVVAFSVESIVLLLKQLEEARPVDVLLCDYAFDDTPQADGLNLLRKIKRIAPSTHVLFLSAHAVPHIISGVLELGAAGFIGKSKTDFANLPQAIRTVQTGHIYLPSSLSSLLLEQVFWKKNQAVRLEMLSERELVVVRMICEGFSVAAIAERLHRSPKTVSNQKLSAMKKLGANNDIELSRIFRDLSS